MSWNACLRRRPSLSTVRYYPEGILGANKKNNGKRKHNQYSGQNLNTEITEYGVEVRLWSSTME
jgi:hypothetical protein